MDMIIIAYWTQTGNTKAMAEAVGEGVEIAGKKADVRHISEGVHGQPERGAGICHGLPGHGG